MNCKELHILRRLSLLVILLQTATCLQVNNRSLADHIEDLLDSALYNRLERPFFNEGKPVDVDVGIYVHSISSLSEMSMDFSVNLFLRQKWVDPRLAFDSELENDTGVVIHYDLRNKIWVPDSFIGNEKSNGDFHDITTPNVRLTISPSGGIFFSQRISSTLSCPMGLHMFPMDKQECSLVLEIYGHTTDDIKLNWDAGTSIEINNELQLPEFELTKYSTFDCTKSYSTGDFSCIKARLHLTRIFSYYLFQVYMPSIFVVVLSWVSFWIDKNAVPARISVGLLTVLTISTQASGMNASMPRVSYLKALDIWIFTCMLFVFGAFLEYAIVNVLARKHAMKEKKDEAYKNVSKQDTSKLKVESNSNKEALPLGDSSLNMRHRGESNGGVSHSQISLEEQKEPTLSTKKTVNQAKLLDKVCRYVFPGVFFLFNIGYWIYFKQVY